MPQIIFLPHSDLCPDGAVLEGEKGESVLNVALKNDIDIEHACEKVCACTTCHVFVIKGLESLSEATDDEEAAETTALSAERYAELGAAEQFILTISANGYGKRSSAYEYRVSGRGGKGIIAMTLTERNGDLLAAFPVEDSNQVMLVSDNGTLIRCPVDDVRIAGRNTQGVTIFKTEEDATVVSVARLGETSDDDDDGETDETGEEPGDNSAAGPQSGDE